jgi:hypothetical protein
VKKEIGKGGSAMMIEMWKQDFELQRKSNKGNSKNTGAG